MLSKELVATLLCPRDRSQLRLADAALVQRVNDAVAAGQLQNVGGQKVKSPIEAGLIREDETLLYPVIEQIPVLLPDEAIEVTRL
ncbi:Trm112 family protein [Pirellulales bacterium]|nr:Trm112 family protein [Pirellulales bacterium]